MKMKSQLPGITATLLPLCIAFALYGNAGRVLLNLGYVDLASTWLVRDVGARPERWLRQALAAGEPVAGWALGWAAVLRGDITARDDAWGQNLATTPARLPLYRVVWAEQRDRAELAHRRYPDEPLAAFWLAELVAEEDAPAAIRLYAEGLGQDSKADRAWYALAQLYEHTDQPQQAFAAYVQACYNGDPGFNACLRAGQQAEGMGRIDWAIALYSRSLWEPAQQQAARLKSAQPVP